VADLAQALATVRDRIARHQRENIGEQDTKAALIVPVLRALGWDVEDLEDVKLEYRRRPVDNPVDYALFLLRSPRLFIEAKSLGSRLGARIDDGKWASQILAYATVAGVGPCSGRPGRPSFVHQHVRPGASACGPVYRGEGRRRDAMARREPRPTH
jgi:predicted type IV restriction endonuclease